MSGAVNLPFKAKFLTSQPKPSKNFKFYVF